MMDFHKPQQSNYDDSSCFNHPSDCPTGRPRCYPSLVIIWLLVNSNTKPLSWAFGLVVWFSLWVREVPSSILGTPLLCSHHHGLSSFYFWASWVSSTGLGSLPGNFGLNCKYWASLVSPIWFRYTFRKTKIIEYVGIYFVFFKLFYKIKFKTVFLEK